MSDAPNVMAWVSKIHLNHDPTPPSTYNAAARALRDLDLTVDLHPFAAMTPPRPALRPSRYPRQPIQRNQ